MNFDIIILRDSQNLTYVTFKTYGLRNWRNCEEERNDWRTSFHIGVSGILDISFLCARIPFQRLTCYSFYKSAVQPLPRTFLKNRRAFVLSLHISRSTFECSIISEESQSSINARHEDAFMSSRSREIRSFVKKEPQYGSLESNVENGFIIPDTYFEILHSHEKAAVIASENLSILPVICNNEIMFRRAHISAIISMWLFLDYLIKAASKSATAALEAAWRAADIFRGYFCHAAHRNASVQIAHRRRHQRKLIECNSCANLVGI